MYPDFDDYASDAPLDFEGLRHEVVTGVDYAPSFGRTDDLQEQIDMLKREFSGQSRLKLVHAVLNVLLRRKIAPETVYAHFRSLWSGHGDFLVETLDSRWLVSACDTICDHAPDPSDRQAAILVSLFVNTLKLAETERLIDGGARTPQKGGIAGHTPLFDGMTAFTPGRGDMPMNLLDRLDRTLDPATPVGLIGRELVQRALCADTVFARFATLQVKKVWRPYLTPTPPSPRPAPAPPQPVADDEAAPGYLLLNDTSRLGDGFHVGTAYACQSIRHNLARRGLREIGWANDRARFEAVLAGAASKPALVVLNGEGTLHHGAPRAAELLSLCRRATEQGIRVAVLNSVWEANPDEMAAALRAADLVHVRDGLSRDALPAAVAAKVTPDVSIQLFLQVMRAGRFQEPQHETGVMDSVLPEVSEVMLDLAEAGSLPFYAMPGRNLHALRASVAARSGPVRPRLLQLTDVMAARAWVTGRFHGLIAALCAGRPVCAVASNTSKVEGLLADANLTEACLLGRDWLSAPTGERRAELARRFEMQRSADFIERRNAFLDRAAGRIDGMFDDTAALARGELRPAGKTPAGARLRAFGRSLRVRAGL